MISNMLRFPLSMFDEDMDKWFFPEFTRASGKKVRYYYPPINVGTTGNSVEVYLFVPGMKPEELDIVVEKNLLSIAGERKLPEAADESVTYRQERFDGRFKRVITLPDDVDNEAATATYRDGVLHISIAKRAEAQPRQIKVSV